MQRDNRIDLIRGYAMFTICVNHITVMLDKVSDVGLKIPTLTHYGYSSAAEVFFFMSGYMVGMVYLNKPNFAISVSKRALHLYRVNLFLFFILAMVGLAVNDAKFLNLTQLDYFSSYPLFSIFQYAAFSYSPKFTPLLFVYVVLLISAIPLAFVLNNKPRLFISIILCIYLVPLYFPQLNFINVAEENGRWGLNVLSYQLLFMLGLYFGKKKLIDSVFDRIEKSADLILILTFCTLIFIYAIKRYDLLGINGGFWVDKKSLGPVRVIHFVVVLMFLMSFLTVFRKNLGNRFFTTVALVGRQSLAAFVTSLVCCYVSLAFWIFYSSYPLVYYILAVGSVFIMILFSLLTEKYKKYSREKLVNSA